MELVPATSSDQVTAARKLFEEFVAWLGVDLSFQGFNDEVTGLPGLYAPPRGRLILAEAAPQTWAGCIALRPLSASCCEMKRLYVRPAYRRQGLGKRLAVHIIKEARSMRYSTMVLDTLSHMEPAIRLYESLGFYRRSAYYETPLSNTVFMELTL